MNVDVFSFVNLEDLFLLALLELETRNYYTYEFLSVCLM